ncbi:MAG: ATP-binding protein [Myxococcales bacterium]|nr:ATP-binding protein [Myxococcales bacterium]
MTTVTTASTPPDPGQELRAIIASVQLGLFHDLAWREHRAVAPETVDALDEDAAVRAWAATDPRGRELSALRAQADAAVADGGTRLQHLAGLFGLDARERDVVRVLLAAALAPDLAGAFAWLDGRGVPTEAAVTRLCRHGLRRVVTPDSPLARWELVRRVDLAPGEPDGLILDPAIVDWFTGAFAIEAPLVALARPVAVVPPLPSWPIDEVAAELAARWRSSTEARAVRVIVRAPSGTGRASFAAALAQALGLRLLSIDGDGVDDLAWPEVVRRAHRQAFLTQTAMAFTGEAAGRRPWPQLPAAFPLTAVCVEPGAVVAPLAGALDVTVALPPSTPAERLVLWRRIVPAASGWTGDERDELARRYRATPADLVEVANRNVASPDRAAAVIRDRDGDRLGELARRIECPFDWDDLVLPSTVIDGMRDFAYEGGIRDELWRQPGLRRMFPSGRGLFMLLTGAPGTGKTMAAQVIARGLGLNLYRISLATVISKYIGETAKNLTRILARAEHMDAVLLFDEADALFGKRTEIKDAHDRYANTDTNHLLQAIEAYAGVAILTSNKRGNIDPAFIRRLRYVLELPRPDATQRRQLWRQLVRDLGGEACVDRIAPALGALAAIDLTGAQIKYAVLAAVVAARRDGDEVSAAHLVRGVARELQKDGRSLSEREREVVAHAV